MTFKVLGICGSLRKASLNMAALRACRELLPEAMALEIADIGELPMYNQDVFDTHRLPRVQLLDPGAAQERDRLGLARAEPGVPREAQGRLSDETTRKFLTELLAGFKTWIARMQPR